MPEKDISLKVEGMTCNNCAAGISKSLHKAGFRDADASFMDEEVTFTLSDDQQVESAINNIESLGYTVADEAETTDPEGLSKIEKKFIASLIFTLPLFLHMFVPKSWFLNDPLVQIAFCLPVYAIGFFHFGKSALGSIRAGLANMDVLIFMGSTAAFVYSIAGTAMYWGSPDIHNYLFYETTATIITLVLLGNVLEHRSVKQTTKNIGELGQMQKTVARVVMRLNDKEKIINTDPRSVKAGDELQVNEGDHIPVDGTVISGIASIDESALTGESDLVEKPKGSPVYSGTTLVSGNIRLLASKPAKDSTLEQIIKLVKKARKDQPKIQDLGDKVSGIFVPAVMAISVLTFVLGYWAFSIGLTQAIMNAVAVLVISCPCAMGLATPTAVVAGVGRAAKNGVLIKGGSTLERFAKAKTIIFDKTGTLTSGEFSVKEETNSIGNSAGELICGLEQHSSHPIATSLLQHFKNTEAAPLTEVEELKGRGVQGLTADRKKVFFGKNAGRNKTSDLSLQIDDIEVATYSIHDSLLTGSTEMVKTFQKAGFSTVLLSGDRESKVKETAKKLGIDRIHFEMSPQEKLDFIENTSKKEQIVMVGDGINDGPALSRAHVGISPGGATALAIDSARVVLMGKDEMQSLAFSYKISKHTYKTIKQNLFWAFAYNVVAIPMAAIGLLNPMIAALAMAFSDVVVIGNSLRLKVKKLG